VRQDFRGNVGMVVNGDVVQPPRAKPPNDARVARICPQCSDRTWRKTQHCMHCGLDLFGHDQDVANEQRRQANQRLAIGLSVFAIAMLGMAWLMEGAWKLVPFGLAFLAMSLAVSLQEKE
jgi:hypothetical protein